MAADQVDLYALKPTLPPAWRVGKMCEQVKILPILDLVSNVCSHGCEEGSLSNAPSNSQICEIHRENDSENVTEYLAEYIIINNAKKKKKKKKRKKKHSVLFIYYDFVCAFPCKF